MRDFALRQHRRPADWRLRNCLLLICGVSVACWAVLGWAMGVME